MPNYKYKASARDGNIVSGKIEATSEEALNQILRDRGLFPISVSKESVLSKDLDINILKKRTSLKDLYLFSRQLSSLLNAGVTVLDSLAILRQQNDNKNMKKVLDSVYDSVQKGNSLSYAIQGFPDVFPSIFIHMIEAGEISGSLDVSLQRLSAHFEKESKMNNKIKGALSYPIVVLCFAILAVIVVILFIIPQFEEMFLEMGVTMPFFTQLLLNISAFVKKFWYIVILLIVAVIIAYRLYAKTDKGKVNIGKILLKIPYVGSLNLKVASTRFANTLGTMLASGVSLFTAIDISGRVVGNEYVKQGLSEVSDRVSKGSTMGEPLEKIGMFPPMVVHMVKVGETTGEIETLLKNTADYYEDEVDTAVAQLTAVMEPLIILVLGVVVLIIVLAVFMPMLSLYEGMGNM